jgi:hypothetical protein
VGDRISLPPSFLQQVNQLYQGDDVQDKVLTFQLRASAIAQGKPKEVGLNDSPALASTQVPSLPWITSGVKDFNAKEGEVLIPKEILCQLNLSHGSPISVEKVQLPRATHIILQPRDAYYLGIVDIRAELETYLRSHYTTLTQGHIFSFSAFIPQLLEIRECQFKVENVFPDSNLNAVCLINTDVTVDIIPNKLNIETFHKTFEIQAAKYTPPVIKLTSSEPCHMSLNLEPNQAVTYRVVVPSDRSFIHVNIETSGIGNVNIYAHPLLRPSIWNNSQMNVSHSSRKQIICDNKILDSYSLKDAGWNVSFHETLGKASCEVSVQILCSDSPASISIPSNDEVPGTTSETVTPDMSTCEFCGKGKVHVFNYDRTS